MLGEPIPSIIPDTPTRSEHCTRQDQDAQLHVYDPENREVVLSTMSVPERRSFFESRFQEIQKKIEAIIGEKVRIVPSDGKFEVFIESNNSTIPDGGLEYSFVYPDDTSEVDINYVYNFHSPDNRQPIDKKPIKGVTSLVLSYLLMKNPRIRKIHALLSETNAMALKRPAVHTGKYAQIANVPLYKSQASLGFGKVVEVVGGNLTTGYF